MNDCKKSRLLFDEAFFGELTNEDKTFLDRHLDNCPKCRTQLDQNTALLSAATTKKADEPPSDFWDNYTANLHRRMESEGLLKQTPLLKKKPKIGELTRQISDWFATQSVPVWALKGATAAILVIVGIFIGRYAFAPGTLPTPAHEPDNQNNSLLTADLTQQQNILRRTGSFIDRSRVILLAIENFDPETESAQAINLPFQKEISRDLLKQAIVLKKDLSGIHRRRLEELINELEVILLQIANINSGSEMETLQLVKGGRYIHGLLYKIRINDLRRSTYKINEKKTI